MLKGVDGSQGCRGEGQKLHEHLYRAEARKALRFVLRTTGAKKIIQRACCPLHFS